MTTKHHQIYKKRTLSNFMNNFKMAFVDVKYKKEVILPKEYIDSLPKKIILFTTVQFIHQYDAIKKQLTDNNIEVITVRPKHAWNEGQILGCSVEDWNEYDAPFAYIGDGLFHPTAILFKNNQPVHIYDPKIKKSKVITKEEIDTILKKRKGALVTFYTAKKVGILITTKYGQNRIKEAASLEQFYPEKEFFYLVGDTIDFDSLEDFPFIECYINTACPRIMDDHGKLPRPVLNIADLEKAKVVW